MEGGGVLSVAQHGRNDARGSRGVMPARPPTPVTTGSSGRYALGHPDKITTSLSRCSRNRRLEAKALIAAYYGRGQRRPIGKAV